MRWSEQPYKDFSARLFDRSVESFHPLRAQFEMTYRCNLHCLHCYTDPFNTPGDLRREMTFEEICGLLDQLAEAGVLWVTLTGGEAFSHPRFRDIYKAAKERGFIIGLFSNGTMITDSLVEFLAEDPPFTIEISLHAAVQKTFDDFTQVPGSFLRFHEGVQKLIEAGLPVKFKTKAMTFNKEELPAIKDYVESWGLDFNLYTALYPRLNNDLGPTQYRLSPEEIVRLEYDGVGFDEDERCNKSYKAFGARLPEAAWPRKGTTGEDKLFRCGCGTNSVTISPYGILRACTFTTWPEYDLKTMSVGEAFQRLVREIQNAHYSGQSLCRTCPVIAYCDKNPVMAQAEAGSMEAPVKHFCDVAYGRAEKEAVRPR